MSTDKFEKKDNPGKIIDSKTEDKNRFLIIVIAVVIVLIGVVVFFVFKPFPVKSPTKNKEVKNSTLEFSKTNPFKAKVNPFKDIKTNPFR